MERDQTLEPPTQSMPEQKKSDLPVDVESGDEEEPLAVEEARSSSSENVSLQSESESDSLSEAADSFGFGDDDLEVEGD